jgi:hypothetical protein
MTLAASVRISALVCGVLPLCGLLLLQSRRNHLHAKEEPMDREPLPLDAEIARLRAVWTDALRERDDTTLDRLMADDFVFIDERGRWGKERFIANVRRWDIVGMDFEDVLVRDYEPVAVMHARVGLRARLDGREMSGEWYVTDLWVRRDGSWQVVSRQWSRGSTPET